MKTKILPAMLRVDFGKQMVDPRRNQPE